MREQFTKTLFEHAKSDPNIVLITGDLGFGLFEPFAQTLPKQFINSGINEQSMMGMAAGYASTGKRVFVYSIANFVTLRCLEQIRNNISLMDNSVVIVGVGGGYDYGSQGYTHHALEDIAVMRSIPNIEILIPADSFETRELTSYLALTERPSYLRLEKSTSQEFHNNELVMLPGKINEIISGEHGTLIFSGSIGDIALQAAKKLNDMRFFVSVASLSFVTNIDSTYLKLACKKGPIVIIEEHSMIGGLEVPFWRN